MPIKWSAVKVSEAMDKAEELRKKAAVPLVQVKMVAEEARKITNLPGYMDDRLKRLLWEVERLDNVRSAIESVRKDIPDGAIEAELEAGKHGKTQSLM